MTMSITIKRDTSGADHNAEVRTFDANATGLKCLVETRHLKVGEEVSINIWGTRSLEVCEHIEPVAAKPDAEPIMQFFAYEHLPAHLQGVSKPFGQLAQFIVDMLPRNAERTVALRKLLEAKDAGVRALLTKAPSQT